MQDFNTTLEGNGQGSDIHQIAEARIPDLQSHRALLVTSCSVLPLAVVDYVRVVFGARLVFDIVVHLSFRFTSSISNTIMSSYMGLW